MNKEICWAPGSITTAKQRQAAQLRADIEAYLADGGEIEPVPAGVSGNENRSPDSAEYKRMVSKNRKAKGPSEKARNHVRSLFAGGKGGKG